MKRCLLLVVGLLLVALLPVARAEVVESGNVRVSFRGWINPDRLPRVGAAPISLHVAGSVDPVKGATPVALLSVTIEINRHGTIETNGLPRCPWRKLEARTSKQALQICGDALVGTGHFTSHVDIPEQAPFPADGRMLAFNARIHGRKTLVAHIYGKDPVPTSQVLPMSFRRGGHGAFGSQITVTMPTVGPDWGYVTGFDLTLDRNYSYRGQRRSVLSASCPAPADIDEAPFKAARGIYQLADGQVLSKVLNGSCRVAAS